MDAARAALRQALSQRDALREPAAAQVDSARSDVEKAEAQLAAARASLDQLLAGASIADQVAAQGAVDRANAALRTAQSNLATLLNGGTETQQVTAQASVRTNAAALLDARLRHAQAGRPPSTLDAFDLAAQVIQANRLLDNAQTDASTACATGAGFELLDGPDQSDQCPERPGCLPARGGPCC